MGTAHLLELADTLLAHIATSSADPEGAMEAAGHSWGQGLPDPELPEDGVVEAMAEHLAERGFGTTCEADTLTFTRCPFRKVSSLLRHVLSCALYEGLLRGLVDPGDGGQFRWLGSTVAEAFGVSGVGGVEGLLPLGADLGRGAEVH